MSNFEAIVRWILTLTAIAIAFYPVVRWMFRPLRDGGISVLGPVATIGVVLPTWWFAAGLGAPYSTMGLWITVVAIGIAAWGWGIRSGHVGGLSRATVLTIVLSKLAVFAAGVWLRGFTPDLTGTEKPMDIAFLSSSAITTVMPPADPWFAGEPINYYALGYIVWGAISRMSGVPPTIAFNLAIPTLLAFAAVGAGGVAWNAVCGNLGRRLGVVSAVSAGFLLAFAGNLWAPAQLLRHGQAMISAWWWDGTVGIGWRSSRIVCDGPREGAACAFPSVETINEFPFFSFLLGDLHPHVMALPVTIAVVAAALSIAMRSSGLEPRDRMPTWLIVAYGVLAGSLYPLNSWDLPTYLGLIVITLWVFGTRGRQWLTDSAVLVVSAIVAWLPFWLRYDPPTGLAGDQLPETISRIPVLRTIAATIGLHFGERTSLTEFLTIFGVPVAIFILFLLTTPGALRPPAMGRGQLVAIVGFLLLMAIGTGSLVGLIAVVLAYLAGRVALEESRTSSERFAALVGAVAMVLVAGVEFFYIQDVFHSRLNTLFKIYYQVWTLLAIGSGIGLAIAAHRIRRPVGRAVLAVGGVVACASLLVYPVVASYQWSGQFKDWRGLDGIAYGAASNPDEYAVVTWLLQHATPEDVILEAAGCSYQPVGEWPMNRASAYTGVPAVIGWSGHEVQWRGGQPELKDEIGPRAQDVRIMFDDPNGNLAEEFGVSYLLLGAYETGDWRGRCDSAGPYAGTDQAGYPGSGWTVVVDTPTAKLYQRNSS